MKSDRRKTKWKNDFARSVLNKKKRQETHKKLHPKDIQSVEQATKARIDGVKKREIARIKELRARMDNADRSSGRRRKRSRDDSEE
jgi:c-di-AMP phosphodiesterase-like protein